MDPKKSFTVKKRPIEVSVDFALNNGRIATIEGVISYEKGDAIITGTQGEQWPVKRDYFFKRYTPAGDQKIGEYGKYRPVLIELKAWQLDKQTQIKLSGKRGVLTGNKGDWVIKYDGNDYGIVNADIFRATYVIVSKNAVDNS